MASKKEEVDKASKEKVNEMVGKALGERITEWGEKNNIPKRETFGRFVDDLSERCKITIDVSTVRNWTGGRRRPRNYANEINEILNEPADKFASKFDVNEEIAKAERKVKYMMNQKKINLTELSSICTIEDMKNTVFNLWDELCIDEKYSYPVRFVGKKVLIAMIGLAIGESLVTGNENTEEQIGWETVASSIRELMQKELSVWGFHKRFVMLERNVFGGGADDDDEEYVIFDENIVYFSADVSDISPDKLVLIEYILKEWKKIESIYFKDICSEMTVLFTEILDEV